MKKIIVLLLCLLMLVGCTPANNKDNNEEIEELVYNVPEYYHYEIGDYAQRCQKLAEEAENGTFDANLYEELYQEDLLVNDLSSVAYVIYCNNVNDEHNEEESTYIDSVLETVNDCLASASHKVCVSSCADEFKKYLNNDYLFNDYLEYNEKSQEELDLLEQETNLEHEYNSINSKLYDYSAEYNGVSYTYEQLLSEECDDFYYNDYEGFMNTYYKILEDFNKDCGEVFLKLVDIRTKIAKLNGYDSFADYADEKKYNRNYDISKLDTLKKVTKEYGDYVEFYTGQYRKDTEIELTTEELLDNAQSVIKEISPNANRYFDAMRKYNMYSIDSDQNRYDGSYVTTLFGQDSGLLFLTITDTLSDYITLAHEFGHFYNTSLVKCTDPVIFNGSYDLFEIHSSGLEILFCDKAKDLLGDKYDILYAGDLSDNLYTIVLACILDDWQREIYNNPDMTLEEINEAYYRINNEYGFYSEPEEWVFIPHNFESPMYYMSYGVSFFTSLQIWLVAQNDFDKAVQIWEDIEASNCYAQGYFDVIDQTELTPFTNENNVEETYIAVLTYLDDVYAEYIENN